MLGMIIFCVVFGVMALAMEIVFIPAKYLSIPSLTILAVCTAIQIYWLINYIRFGNIHGRKKQ